MVTTMPQTGKNKGNKNAELKPGQLGRVQWTQTLSGEPLRKFIQHYGIDPQLDEKELRQQVSEKARAMFEKMIEEL